MSARDPLDQFDPLMRDLLRVMSIPFTDRPPRIPVELEAVTIGQLMMALRYSGLVVTNRDGVLVIHPSEKREERA